MSDALTQDDFLGGRIKITQPQKGYRAGVDAVLLASAVAAHSGQSVLDLGCGVGTAALCLHARGPNLRMVGIEIQDNYAALARENARDANADLSVVVADVADLPNDIRQMQFDHVITNPPYFERSRGHSSTNAGRDTALGGATSLEDWLIAGIKRVAAKGTLTVIQRVERLPEVMKAIDGRMGSIRLRPIVPREGKPGKLFLLQAKQDGKAPFVLLPPLVMHEGNHHIGGVESYTAPVRAILRGGEKLGWDG
ncbi:tRNA1(Val) (adenine(37)-N6)-methyltransferase [Cognatiyoonia sp.]|uniref:tRNA1(Val) (adenine(37)-N6)-methyltransferase n=1 Tax=Cognatiyoonia sp. TaxID=2211652 RepID=UPI003F69B7F1